MHPKKLIESQETKFQEISSLSQIQFLKDDTTISYISQQSIPLQSDKNELRQDLIIPNLKALHFSNIDKSKEKEKQYVYSLIGLPKPKYFYLESKWARNYTLFLNGKKKTSGCRPIDNTLILNNTALKPNLKQDIDYVLINESVWSFIIRMYGGGPEVRDNYNELHKLWDDDTYEVPIETTVGETRITSLYCYDNNRRNSKVIQFVSLPIIGLRNQKYLCYINCMLQALMALPKLNGYVLKSNQEDNKFSSLYQNFLRLVCKLQLNNRLRNHHRPLYYNQKIYILYSPIDLIHPYNMIPKSSFCTSQGRCMMNRANLVKAILQMIYSEDRQHILSNVGSAFKSVPPLNPSLISLYPFSTKITFFSFYRLKMRQVDLNECLRSYFKQHFIEQTWICVKCNSVQNKMIRTIELTKNPSILVLHLKRFQNYPRKQKIKEPIQFHQNIDIAEFCSKNIQKSSYALRSLIIHQGMLDIGHYKTASFRDNKWYIFDDETVEQSNAQSVFRLDQGYIFIYELI